MKWFTFIWENSNYTNGLLLAHNVLPFLVGSFSIIYLILSHSLTTPRLTHKTLIKLFPSREKSNSIIYIFFLLEFHFFFALEIRIKKTNQQPQFESCSNCIIKKNQCFFCIKTVFDQQTDGGDGYDSKNRISLRHKSNEKKKKNLTYTHTQDK